MWPTKCSKLLPKLSNSEIWALSFHSVVIMLGSYSFTLFKTFSFFSFNVLTLKDCFKGMLMDSANFFSLSTKQLYFFMILSRIF